MDEVLTENYTPVSNRDLRTVTAQSITVTSVAEYYNVSIPLHKSYNAIFKRCFDVIVSSILIAGLLTWLIPLLAIIIRCDSRGPVFFRQKRNGEGSKLFTCLKFRSMV